MSSVRNQILDAVVTALNTDRPAGIPAARRRRIHPYEMEDVPAIDVVPVEESVEGIGGRLAVNANRRLQFAVRCWAAGDAPEVAADALLLWAVKALDGNRLGGLVESLFEVRTGWVFDVGDTVVGVAETVFLAEYATRRGSADIKL